MAILTRHSVIGVVCGVLCTLLLETTAAALFMNSFSSEDGDSPSMEASFMPLSVRLGDLEGGVVDMYGQKIRFADLRGKVVVVNLWATWCPPCRREMPVLDAARRREPGIRFVFVNQGEGAGEVARFLAGQRFDTRDVLLDGGGRLGALVGSRALPTTLFYGADGRLLGTHLGELSDASLAQALEALRSGAHK